MSEVEYWEWIVCAFEKGLYWLWLWSPLEEKKDFNDRQTYIVFQKYVYTYTEPFAILLNIYRHT